MAALIRAWLLLAAAFVPMVVLGCLAALWVWYNVWRRGA